MPVQLQQWSPRDWQDHVCSQGKQNYLCIMAGVELEKNAIGHEISNQQSEKQSLANTTQSWIAFGTLVATYNFAASLFCTAQSLLRTGLDHGRLWLSQSCHCHIAAFVVEIWSQLGRTILGPCQYNFNSGVHAIGKTTFAPKTNKTSTAWWLAANSKKMPLALKSQINNQKSKAWQTQHKAGLHLENWSLPTTLHFQFTAQSLLGSAFRIFRPWSLVAGRCPKVVIVA